tara:strand:+ start:314 stop:655 length:342 start_codon:yes stop_codon:yes gene_type:complete
VNGEKKFQFHPSNLSVSFIPNSLLNKIKEIKKAIRQYRISNDNIHNRIEAYTSDGLVIWFSSNTEINQKGSIMAYRVQDEQVHTLFATVENKSGWQITKTKGIELNELKAYLE